MNHDIDAADADAAPPSRPEPDGTLESLLTVHDVCTWFRVQPEWVYDEVEAGRLPFIRVGRRLLRFRRTELERYLEATTAHAHATPPRPAWKPAANTLGLEPLE